MKDSYSLFRDKNGFWCGILSFKEKYVKELTASVNTPSMGKLIEWFLWIMRAITLTSRSVHEEKVLVEWSTSNLLQVVAKLKHLNLPSGHALFRLWRSYWSKFFSFWPQVRLVGRRSNFFPQLKALKPLALFVFNRDHKWLALVLIARKPKNIKTFVPLLNTHFHAVPARLSKLNKPLSVFLSSVSAAVISARFDWFYFLLDSLELNKGQVQFFVVGWVPL